MTGMVETYRGTVYPWHCDHVGHMNVMWYVGKFDEATWQFFSRLGVTPDYLRSEQRGMAAVDQHIRYKRELHAGDVVEIHTGLLEIREKMIHFVHEMRHSATGAVAAVCELTGVHLDSVARRACPFPDSVMESAAPLVVSYDFNL